ncbi:hypothetical protein PV328_001231 [Microctonus aethiopoides]|uniref:Uncharacterized protein n=1 Tax=Microctonus aethiopoides TaxID=144406 RepID=A0AA39FWH9_9HYME|nr:hypothetical protein PV328_001231 [Microctonus aethiopoides]
MADPSTVTPTEDTKQETSRPSSPSTLSIPQIQIISRDNNSTDQAGDTTIIQEISEKVALPPASTSRTRSQSAPNQTNTTEYRVNSKLSRLEMMKRTARYCHDHEYDNIDEIEGQLSLLKDLVKIAVSSANSARVLSLELGMSFMKIMNKIGPRTEPCVTLA